MDRRTFDGMAAACLAISLLVAITAAAGIFCRGDGGTSQAVSVRGERYAYATSGVYRFNAQRIVAEGIGWDVVTLFGVVPAMLLALASLRRGSLRGRLFAVGLLGYFFYQYLMYAVTWAFGPLFPLFVVIYGASLAALVWLISTIDLASLAAASSQGFPRRGMAVLCFSMSGMLVLMWAARIVAALRGEVEGALMGQTTMVVQALDLGIVVPLAVFTGWAAWQGRPVGYLLCSTVVVKVVAMCAAICAMLVSAWVVQGTLEVVPFAIFALAAVAATALGRRMYATVHP